MPIASVRNLNTAQTRAMAAGRVVCRLANGNTAVVIIDATSATANSLYVYMWNYDATGQPFTLSGPFTIGTLDTVLSGKGNLPRVAMTSDSNNKLHIVATYSTGAGTIGVKYFRWDAPSQTLETTQILKTQNALNDYKLDIDVANSGAASVPVIAITTILSTVGGGAIEYYTVVGTTVTHISGTTCTGSTYFNNGSPLIAPVGVAAVHSTQALISGVQGIAFWYWIFNTNNSIELHYKVVGQDGSNPTDYNLGTPLTGMPISLFMFTSHSVPGDEEVLIGAVYKSNPNLHIMKFQSGALSLLPVFSNNAVNHGVSNFDDRYSFHNLTDRYTYLVMGLQSRTNSVQYRILDLTGNAVAVTGSAPYNFEADTYNINVSWNGAKVMYGGCNRYIDDGVSVPDIMILHPTSAHPSGIWTICPILTPGLSIPITPNAGNLGVNPSPTVVNTAVPNLAISTVGNTTYGVQSDYFVTWEWALDQLFTTGVIDTTSSWVQPGSSVSKTLETIKKLTQQGNWYLRAKCTDRFKKDSSWVGHYGIHTPELYNPLNVTHPPVATPTSPSNGGHVGGGPGLITFLFSFSDTSAPATQTGYQVQIATGISGGSDIVEDSGVVTSTVGLYASSLWSGGLYLDQAMLWRVAVIDDDGVQGAFCAWQNLTVVTPPAPTIIVPASGSTITTSLLTASWTSGVAVGKTQAKFRVVLQDGSTLVYDSGTLAGADTSLALPFGTIHNGHSYTLTVFVTDSDGIIGATLAVFTVALTLPAAPDGIFLFDYMFTELGFVWIGWDSTEIDTDFSAWNVYRRGTGEVDWTLLASVTDRQPFYGIADETANSNLEYTYCVNQVVNRSGLGDIIESLFSATQVTTLSGTWYWLVDTESVESPIAVHNATVDSYTDETERAVLTVIGAGRHVDEGEHLGLNGTLTCQLRDHPIGLVPTTNILRDPSFQDNAPFSTAWAYLASNSVSYTMMSFIESSPLATKSFLRTITPASANVTFKQTNIGPPIFQMFDVYNASIWIADVKQAWGFKVEALVDYYDSTHTLIHTDVKTLVEVDDLDSNGNWKRFASPFFVPEPAVASIDITYRITDTSATGLDFLIAGAQVTPGQDLLATFDGNSQGSLWDGLPNVSTSTTNGFYTAREQRQDITMFRGLGHPIYLRTPFGDIYKVNLQDLQFDRLAGVGSESEYGQLTIPYMQVAL